MSSLQQVHDDLHFVREAVASQRQSRRPAAAAIYGVWAAYVLAGYSLIDFYPAIAGRYFLIAGAACSVLSWLIGRRYARVMGEIDRPSERRRTLHFIGGILLAAALPWALAAVIPALRGPAGGQVTVVMIGLVYFLGGIHFDRNLLWLGPMLMAGGVLVGLTQRYGWTALGGVIAAGLVLPSLWTSRRQLTPETTASPAT